MPCLALYTPALAQDFVLEKFDQSLINETLKDQEILREEMILEQEILREEMEQIRLEIQRIMREIAISMKAEALKLKAELEGLQGETQRIKEEIIAALEKSKKDFTEGQEEMRKELQKMRQEAKTLTNEIKEVLDDQKAIWKQETAALQGSLVEARDEMNSAKAESAEVLKSSRSAINVFKKEKVETMADSRSKSGAAMFEAGNTFKKVQQDYKMSSENIAKELMADMKETRKKMRRKQVTQKRDSKKAQREIVAALKTAKHQRISERKKDSRRNKIQKKKNIRSKHKQSQKHERIKKVEKRQALLSKAKTERRKTSEKKKAQKGSKIKEKKYKRTLDSRKTKKPIAKKPDSKQSPPARREIPASKISKGKQTNLDKNIPNTLGKESSKEFKTKEKTRGKPQKNKITENEGEVVVVAEAPTKTPEESPQEKATRFSKNIASIKDSLKKESGKPGALLAKLGDAYLEAQRFLNSQKDNEERQKILNLSDNQKLLLGSYEQAAWAYKLSLSFKHKSAETHLKIGRVYAEMGDGRNALMHAKLAHQIFKKHDNSKQMEETQTFIEMLTSKYKEKFEKNSA